MHVPPFGANGPSNSDQRVHVEWDASITAYTLENDYIKATIHANGQLIALIHKESSRNCISSPSHVFMVYEDQPLCWDAWDVDVFHLEKGHALADAYAHVLDGEAVALGMVLAARFSARSFL